MTGVRSTVCRLTVGATLFGATMIAAIAATAAPAKSTGHVSTIARLEQALRDDPSSLVLLAELGKVQGWAGRHDEALRTFECALRLDRDDSELRLGHARALAWSGQFDRALVAITNLLSSEPGNYDAQIVLARLHSWRKNHDTAETLYLSALQAHPDGIDALEGLGDLERWRENFAAARAYYARVLALDPQSANLRQKLKSVRSARHWRFDFALERSAFAGGDRPDWSDTESSLRLALDQNTGVAVRVERASRIGTSDTHYAVLLDKRFDERRTGYFAAGLTPAASFLPRHALATGGSWKVREGCERWPATLLLGDYRAARYGPGTAQTLSAGAQQHFTRWASGTGRLLASRNLDGRWTTGWLARLDGELAAGWRWHVGQTDAAESLQPSLFDFTASRRTRAIFGGVAREFSAAFTARIGFTQERTDRAPTRNACHVGITTQL